MALHDDAGWVERDKSRGRAPVEGPRATEPEVSLLITRSGYGYSAGETARFPASVAAVKVRLGIAVEAPAAPPADKAMVADVDAVSDAMPSRRGRSRAVTK